MALVRATSRSPRSPTMNPSGLANAKSRPAQQREEPQRSRRALFPTVGAGASAGGFEAFTQFLQAVGGGDAEGYSLIPAPGPRPARDTHREQAKGRRGLRRAAMP